MNVKRPDLCLATKYNLAAPCWVCRRSAASLKVVSWLPLNIMYWLLQWFPGWHGRSVAALLSFYQKLLTELLGLRQHACGILLWNICRPASICERAALVCGSWRIRGSSSCRSSSYRSTAQIPVSATLRFSVATDDGSGLAMPVRVSDGLLARGAALAHSSRLLAIARAESWIWYHNLFTDFRTKCQ